MTKSIVLTIIAFLSASPLVSQAACIRADLTGVWRIYSYLDSPGRCSLSMPSSGNTINTSSYCTMPGNIQSVPLRGSIVIDSTCHVTGKLTINGQKRSVDAWISRGKDSISGIAYDALSPWNGDDFSGVKQ